MAGDLHHGPTEGHFLPNRLEGADGNRGGRLWRYVTQSVRLVPKCQGRLLYLVRRQAPTQPAVTSERLSLT